MKFSFDKHLSFEQLRQQLPPGDIVTKELKITDRDGDDWNVIAWSLLPLPSDEIIKAHFLEMIHTKIFPCDVQKGE